jgi:hypothetical protein
MTKAHLLLMMRIIIIIIITTTTTTTIMILYLSINYLAVFYPECHYLCNCRSVFAVNRYKYFELCED